MPPETTIHTGHQNYLLLQLQKIADEWEKTGIRIDQEPIHFRLRALIGRVEELGSQPPAEQLLIDVPLPEQEIRARALAAAVHFLAETDDHELVLDLADEYAAYIRDGSRS